MRWKKLEKLLINMSSRSNYQKLFVRRSLRYLPHHTLMLIIYKSKLLRFEKALDTIAKRKIINVNDLLSFDNSDIREYQKLTKETQFWHGTGRWQHGKDGIVDVMKSFCDIAGLKPSRDVYAVFGGSDRHIVHSISLCRSRMVARSYADMHGLGWKEKNRYGDALTWTSYYYGLFYARLFTVNGVKMLRRWKTWRTLSHDENGDNTWGKKVNKQARDVWDVFCLGSDISGNYPILIGVRSLDSQLKLEKPMSHYEVRSDKRIGVANISHIEVPRDKQDEMRELLLSCGIDIPVTSIELGEYVSVQKRFTELLGW